MIVVILLHFVKTFLGFAKVNIGDGMYAVGFKQVLSEMLNISIQ